MLKWKTGFVLAIVLVGGALAYLLYSGFYNVAATDPHNRFERWLLGTIVANSVERRAATLPAPPLDMEQRIADGARSYEQACTACHGAPGVEPMEFTRGLTPGPPHFGSGGAGERAMGWSARELFWIVKNGIKMTGMPGWEGVFSDRQIWSLVAFLQAVPGMTPERYQQLRAAPKADPAESGAKPDQEAATVPGEKG